MKRFYDTAHEVRKHVADNILPDGKLRVPTYVRILKGRFTDSIGRIDRADARVTGRYGNAYTQYFIYVAFETGGRAYKFEAMDRMWGNDLFLSPESTSDADLKRVDENTNKEIPKLTDRYGTPVTIGLMMVVHTHVGLRIGTVKSITPRGSIRFKDFDNSKEEFTKQIWPDGGDSSEIMALQKDFMDQMLLRKLARV
jgi:hypothetical protein